MKKTFLALAMLTGVSSMAHADYQSFMQQPEQPYVGVDYQASRLDTSPEINLGSLVLRAGTQIAPYIGVEVQASIGVQDDDFTNTNGEFTAKNRGSYGIFIRPNYMIGNSVNVYALAGANYADIQVEGTGNVKHNSYGTSFAGGAGIEIMMSPTFSLAADYMQYDSDIQAVNAGVRFRF
ncbi:MAG: Attachment invasion locus protein precursor [Pseudomonadota bacterium]|jgi:hypothetical protein